MMRCNTFEQFLVMCEMNENAIAGFGDWVPIRDKLLDKSLKQLKSEFTLVDTIAIAGHHLELYKMNAGHTYILGEKDSEAFRVSFHIELKERKDVESLLNGKYGTILNVDGVIAEQSMRGYGIAKIIYQYLIVNLGLTILGDELQFHKARLTWKSLSEMKHLQVDIFNIDTGEILEKDVELHHGDEDWDFDDRVWDYGDAKKHIRLLMFEK